MENRHLIVFAILALMQFHASADWPQFRGPQASGVDDPKPLPTEWNVETGKNIRWQASLPGLAHAAPIVWGSRIYVATGNFKGAAEIAGLRAHITGECNRYVNYLRQRGHNAEGLTAIGTDAVEEIVKLSGQGAQQFPDSVFFAGQLVFESETLATRWLHNYTVFALQRRLYLLGLPFVTLPVRVGEKSATKRWQDGRSLAATRRDETG
jgi:hypothetical protein